MSANFEGWTLLRQYRRCGKKGCNSCPHGPYWYGFKAEGKKTRSKYFGRNDPRDVKSCGSDDIRQPDWHPWNAIFKKETATRALAKEILGMNGGPADRKQIREAYRQKMLDCHPDRGGDDKKAAWVNAAYSLLIYGG